MDTYITFDFETSGLDPEQNRILQVGICLCHKGQRLIRSWYVNQPIELTPNEFWSGEKIALIRSEGLSPKYSACKLLIWLQFGSLVVGHNIHQFDVPFLVAECKRLGLEAPDTSDYIDTAAVFKGRQMFMSRVVTETRRDYAMRILSIRRKGLKFNVKHCCEHYGIDINGIEFHSAVGDVVATSLIFEAMKNETSGRR